MVSSTVDHMVAITVFLAATLLFIGLFNQTIQTAVIYQRHRATATKASDLLDGMLYFRTKKGVLDALYTTYGFDYILTAYLDGQLDVFVLDSDPNWALVYWDDVSLLYLRTGAKYESIIARDAYRVVRPEVAPIKILERAGETELLDGIIAELKRNIIETDSRRGRLLLGYACLAKGLLDESKDNLEWVVDMYPRDAEAHYGLGVLYEKTGDVKAAKKQLKIAKAYANYPELKRRAISELESLQHK